MIAAKTPQEIRRDVSVNETQNMSRVIINLASGRCLPFTSIFLNIRHTMDEVANKVCGKGQKRRLTPKDEEGKDSVSETREIVIPFFLFKGKYRGRLVGLKILRNQGEIARRTESIQAHEIFNCGKIVTNVTVSILLYDNFMGTKMQLSHISSHFGRGKRFLQS
ncbi:hypothetical protein TNCV_808251 [Trichonephila clavipes]|nr:hypothetical protein TNCV_808251 [Trichonephila clavipes]